MPEAVNKSIKRMLSKEQDKRAPNSEACLHSASNQKQLLVTSGAPSKAAQHSHPDAASGKEGTTSHEVPARPGKSLDSYLGWA